MQKNNFAKNVFINCPFDKEYEPFKRALLFTLIYLGYQPLISSANLDSGEIRLQKICDLIEKSKFSIHDLSRLKSSRKGEFSRLNMPFELGIDLGCRLYKGGIHKEKRFLVVAQEKYQYLIAISDFAGSDIRNHNNKPETLVKVVRNWFSGVKDLTKYPGHKIWADYIDFKTDFYAKRTVNGFDKKDIEEMEDPEYLRFVSEWLISKSHTSP
jgi:hypothetical protein